jgi:hypothetical protein
MKGICHRRIRDILGIRKVNGDAVVVHLNLDLLVAARIALRPASHHHDPDPKRNRDCDPDRDRDRNVDADRLRGCDHDNACDLDDGPTIVADNDLARDTVYDHDTDRDSNTSVPASIGAGIKSTSATPPAVTLIQNVPPPAIQIATATATATWTATGSVVLTATIPAATAFLPSYPTTNSSAIPGANTTLIVTAMTRLLLASAQASSTPPPRPRP